MGDIVIRKRYDEGTESAEVATSATTPCHYQGLVTGDPSYQILSKINVRENRRVNQECTIRRNRQHWAHDTEN